MIESERTRHKRKIKKCISISGDVLAPNDARNEALKHRQKRGKMRGWEKETHLYSIKCELFSSPFSKKQTLKTKTIVSMLKHGHNASETVSVYLCVTYFQIGLEKCTLNQEITCHR